MHPVPKPVHKPDTGCGHCGCHDNCHEHDHHHDCHDHHNHHHFLHDDRCIHEIYGHEHGRHEFCDHDRLFGPNGHGAHCGKKYGFYIHGNEVKPVKYDKEYFDGFRDPNAVHIHEDMKSSDIVDGYGNTRFRVTMFGVDTLDDDDQPAKRYFIDVVNFMYGPEPVRVSLLPNENPGFETIGRRWTAITSA